MTSQSGYALLTPNGRIHGTSRHWPGAGAFVHITDWQLFLQVEQSPAEYAWLNNQVTHSPAPQPWLQWDGSQWVYDQQTHDDYLAYAKSMMWERIRVLRDQRSEMGYPADGKWWHNDAVSRTRVLGLMIMMLAGGGQIPPGVVWKTMSGELIQLTPQVITMMFQGAATYDVWMFAVAEQHRMAMEATPDPFTYNYSAGWPPVYGE